MDHKEQTTAFHREVTAVLDRFRQEFDLTVAQAVGVLEIVKMELWTEEQRKLNEEEPE